MVRLQAAYAGMVEHTDEHLGRLVAALEEMGELDNTLFVLFSDNGASQEGGEVGSMNAVKFFTGYDSPEQELAGIQRAPRRDRRGAVGQHLLDRLVDGRQHPAQAAGSRTPTAAASGRR